MLTLFPVLNVIRMKTEHKTILHIADVTFEARFTLEINPDGSAIYELKDPVYLPPGTFKLYYDMPNKGK